MSFSDVLLRDTRREDERFGRRSLFFEVHMRTSCLSRDGRRRPHRVTAKTGSSDVRKYHYTVTP